MSLDQFSSDSNDEGNSVISDNLDPRDFNSWGSDWSFYPGGYLEDVDERFYGDGAPNQPPKLSVPNKLAVDIELLQDEDLIKQAVETLNRGEPSEFNEVAKITFNDLSTWHMPLRPWDDDFTRMRIYLVENYLPQIVKWEAILEGIDPQNAIEEWDIPWEDDGLDWVEDWEDVEMDESTRKWFNNNADWLPHIDKEIKSRGIDIELDEEDNGWEDDW